MRSLLLTIAMISAVTQARGEAATVGLILPRSFGFFVGDLVEANIDIRADPGWRLQQSSLPRPGPVTAHLDLRSISLQSSTANGESRWRLRLIYQNQFVALDVRAVHVPALTITLLDGDAPTGISVPGWKFLAAPLREVSPESHDNGAAYLRPDQGASYLDESTSRQTAILLGVASVLAIGLYLRDHALWPFQNRRARAFAMAARRIAKLVKRLSAPERLRESFRALHRSVDQTAGRAIHFEDIDAFLALHPQFRPAAAELRRFFETSRVAFFDSEAEEAHTQKAQEVAELARRLEALERAAS